MVTGRVPGLREESASTDDAAFRNVSGSRDDERVVALRSRRLQSLFGAPLDALTASHVRGLVDAGAQEAFDLDFKLTAYGRGDSDRRALAGDVAAMANTAGGIIVIGIDEDEQARATAGPGVEVTETEIRRVLQVVGALVSPLPVFDVVTVLDEPVESASATGDRTPMQGFILIAVPRSPNAPHAVLVNEALRYPKRNGATTRYLSEPEVAAAYRERLGGATRQVERISQVEGEALARFDREQDAWLLVTLVPDLPGDMVITTATFEEFQRIIIGTQTAIVSVGVSFRRASVGRRRLLADGTMDNSPLAKFASLELHTDGAGAFGMQLYDVAATRQREAGGTGPVQQIVDDESIVVGTLSGILRLAQHARDRAGAGGNVVLRAMLVAATAAQSVEIGHTRRGFGDSRSRFAIAGDRVTAEAVVPLDDVSTPGPALITTAAVLVDEIGQAFGVPEMGQLSRDGKVRRPYWGNQWRPQFVRWAEQHGIEVTDDALGS